MKVFAVSFLLGGFLGLVISAPYYGTKIGRFKTYYHEVVGDVYAVDEKTIFIKDFSYDGAGPDAFFWAGDTNKPDTTGTIIPDEKGQVKPLSPYRNKDLVLRLPEGKTIRDFKWLSVWCRKFRANFGEVFITKNLEIPQPVEIGELSRLAHDVSSGLITMMDSQTFLIRDFKYDGLGPAAFWWVSRGAGLNPRGVQLMDENGSDNRLRRYSGETVIIQLPADRTYLDFDVLGVWCDEAQVDFGHVKLPHDVKVPPSPRMLGLQSENKLNCEVLHDDIGFELRWIMDGDQVVMQMVGKVDSGEYLAFGLGKDDQKSSMINADSIVVWMDQNGKGHAVDYFLGSKEQCVGDRGSCPDTKQGGKESVSLISSSIVNGFTTVTFRRPQAAQDQFDQHIYSDGPQAIMWAVGPINNRNEVSYHRLRTEGNIFIDFSRPPKWNCPPPDTVQSSQPKPTKPPRTTPRPTTTTPPPPPPPPPRTQQRRPANRNQQRGPTQRLPAPKPQTPRQQQLILRQQQSGFRNPPNPRGTVLTTPSPPYYQPESQRVPQHSVPQRFPEPAGPQQAAFDQPDSQRTPLQSVPRRFPEPVPAGPQQVASNPQGVWQIPQIICPADRTFRFQIGPSGEKKGYQGITGKVGWGIAWYVNGLLVPEITVQRGRVYTFIVEGGRDEDTTSSKHHPLYITSDPEGGFEFKDINQRSQETVYAGIGRDRRGNNYPTAAGRLCEFKIPLNDPNPPDAYNSFAEFQRTLELKCEDGAPANLRWRPTKNTPDEVYYQCYTHRLLGWKIRVVDNCDEYDAQGSILTYRNVSAPQAQSLDERPNQYRGKPNSPYQQKKGVPNLFTGKRKLLPVFGQRKPKPTTEKPQQLPIPSASIQRRPNPVQLPHSSAILDGGVLVAPASNKLQPQIVGNNQHQQVIVPSGLGNSQPGDFFLIPVKHQFNLGPIRGPPAIPQVSGTPPLSALPKDNSRSAFPPNFSTLGGNKRVYYHGGFIPVIYNNGTFHENRMPDPTTPPPGFRRPFPFNANESIPFQGTFKPGKPDFSGFTLPKHHVYQPRPEHQVLPIPINPQLVIRPSSQFAEDSAPAAVSSRDEIPIAIPGPSSTTATNEKVDNSPDPIPQPPYDEPLKEDSFIESYGGADKESDEEQSKYSPYSAQNQGEFTEHRDTEVSTQDPEEEFERGTLVEATEGSSIVQTQTSTSVSSEETLLLNPFAPSKEEANKTDYSILSHVMSLIAGQSQFQDQEVKVNSRLTREAKDHEDGHDGHDKHHHKKDDKDKKDKDKDKDSKNKSSKKDKKKGKNSATTTNLSSGMIAALLLTILLSSN